MGRRKPDLHIELLFSIYKYEWKHPRGNVSGMYGDISGALRAPSTAFFHGGCHLAGSAFDGAQKKPPVIPVECGRVGAARAGLWG